MEKYYKGIVMNEVYDEFNEQKGYDLYSHACNGCIIEDYLAIANIFCPDIIEVNHYIFLASMFEEKGKEADILLSKLEKQFNSKAEIEKWINCKSIGEFFIGQKSLSLDNPILLDSFGNSLKYFWELRARELFPEKNIVVEVGNGLMGELGMAVTMYQL